MIIMVLDLNLSVLFSAYAVTDQLSLPGDYFSSALYFQAHCFMST